MFSGFPIYIEAGMMRNSNYVAMPLYGKSLLTIMTDQKILFTKRCVLQIGI